MVDIECTRCGATGTGYPTPYVAKFSLIHNEKCGAKIGIPKYSNLDTTTTSVASTESIVVENSGTAETPKPKKSLFKKKSKKKKKKRDD